MPPFQPDWHRYWWQLWTAVVCVSFSTFCFKFAGKYKQNRRPIKKQSVCCWKNSVQSCLTVRMWVGRGYLSQDFSGLNDPSSHPAAFPLQKKKNHLSSPQKIDVIPMIFQLVQYLPLQKNFFIIIGSDPYPSLSPPKIGEIVKLSLIEKSLCTYVQHRERSLCCLPPKSPFYNFFFNWIRMR